MSNENDTPTALDAAIASYNEAWNAHDLDAIVVEPTGKTIEWIGMDVIPFENGLVKRKDVYSDSLAILNQLGLEPRSR